MLRILIIGPLLAVLLGACGKQTMYAWGDYEGSLYSYYKDPEKVEELMTALDNTIVNAGESRRVPPGIFAEYGYLLLVRNKGGEAIEYFAREKAAWPESAVLMDKMIAVAGRGAKKPEMAGDAGEKSGGGGKEK